MLIKYMILILYMAIVVFIFAKISLKLRFDELLINWFDEKNLELTISTWKSVTKLESEYMWLF